MKKILCFFLVSSLTVSFIFGQSNCLPLSISKILPMTTMTFDDFDTYVTDRCFAFDKIVNVDKTSKRQFKWTGNYKDSPEKIVYGTDDDGKIFITFNTQDDAKYSTLKKEIKALGFQISDVSTSTSDISWSKYKNSTYTISIYYSAIRINTSTDLLSEKYNRLSKWIQFIHKITNCVPQKTQHRNHRTSHSHSASPGAVFGT